MEVILHKNNVYRRLSLHTLHLMAIEKIFHEKLFSFLKIKIDIIILFHGENTSPTLSDTFTDVTSLETSEQ